MTSRALVLNVVSEFVDQIEIAYLGARRCDDIDDCLGERAVRLGFPSQLVVTACRHHADFDAATSALLSSTLHTIPLPWPTTSETLPSNALLPKGINAPHGTIADIESTHACTTSAV